MNDHFFEIYAALLGIMLMATVVFSISITDKQVESKDADGKIKFSKFQFGLISLFRWCMYALLFTAGYTIARQGAKWGISLFT